MKKLLIFILIVALLVTAMPFAVFASDLKIGDVNDSGDIDSLDYILLKRAYFGTFELDDNAETRADVNQNGEVDSMDYILLKRVYFGTYTIGSTDSADSEWTYENGGIDTIVATKDGVSKTIKINIDHLLQKIQNNSDELTVWRDVIYGYGDWIFYKEQYQLDSSSSLSGSTSTGGAYFKIKVDSTQQTKLNDYVWMSENTLHVISLIGVQDGFLYYFAGKGFNIAGVPEEEYLYKIKIDDSINDLLEQGILINQVRIPQEDFRSSYIENGWIYYSSYDRMEDNIYNLYKMKLDGTEDEYVGPFEEKSE